MHVSARARAAQAAPVGRSPAARADAFGFPAIRPGAIQVTSHKGSGMIPLVEHAMIVASIVTPDVGSAHRMRVEGDAVPAPKSPATPMKLFHSATPAGPHVERDGVSPRASSATLRIPQAQRQRDVGSTTRGAREEFT